MTTRMNTDEPGREGGVSRRAALKAAAWSVPVVAVSVATPLGAMSPWVDVILTARPTTNEMTATSPDGSRQYSLALPTIFDVSSPSAFVSWGSTRVLFDNRLLGDITMTLDGVNAPQRDLITTGNITNALFDTPVWGDHVIVVTFGTVNQGLWLTDAQPYTLRFDTGWDISDPDQTNNTIISEAVYSDVTP